MTLKITGGIDSEQCGFGPESGSPPSTLADLPYMEAQEVTNETYFFGPAPEDAVQVRLTDTDRAGVHNGTTCRSTGKSLTLRTRALPAPFKPRRWFLVHYAGFVCNLRLAFIGEDGQHVREGSL